VELLSEEEVGALYDQGKEPMVWAFMRLQDQLAQSLEKVDRLEVRVNRLETQVNQNSQNSSKPPSSDGYRKPAPKSSREKTGLKPGGQVGHTGITLERIAEADHTLEYWPEYCECCGEQLGRTHASGCEIRQVHDIPPVHIETTDHKAMQVRCSQCGHTTQGDFPPQVHSSVQYGSGVMALGVYATMYQLLPFERTCEMLGDLFGCSGRVVSVGGGTLINWISGCALRLASTQERIKLAIHGCTVVHFDETGLRVLKKLYWLHSASTNSLTYYHVDTNRAGEAFDRVGILPGFQGTAVHDALPSYLKRDVTHALCNAHLLRELTALEEQTKQRWPTQLKTTLIEMKDEVAQAVARGEQRLSDDILIRLEADYDRLVKRALQSNPPSKRQPNQKGRARASPARNLAQRLRDRKDSILCFLRDFQVPFDNNLADGPSNGHLRDLRMRNAPFGGIKVKQKISGGFRSLEGAQAFATIRGYISTVRKRHAPFGGQGYSAFAALRAFLDGNPVDLVLG